MRKKKKPGTLTIGKCVASTTAFAWDHTTGSEHLSWADCRGHGVLVNFHILNKCSEKLERMELRLLCKPHGIGHRKRQVRFDHQRGGNAQRLRGSSLRCVFVPPDVL